jgi:hypothetical protein
LGERAAAVDAEDDQGIANAIAQNLGVTDQHL